MKAARIVVLTIAVGAGGIAALLAGRSEKPAPVKHQAVPQVASVDVLVAKSNIPIGKGLSPNDMQWQAWPASAQSGNFIRKENRPDAIAKMSGMIARAPFVAGEPIREAKLINAKGSGFMAAILPSGMRAISTQISAETGAGGATSRPVRLGIGKSVAIDLPAPIKDVLVADPAIANAVIRSSHRVYMIGVKVGQTDIYFFDANGRQIAGFDIAVTRDLNGVRAALRQSMPDSDIRIEGVGDGVMLTGTAATPADSQQAYDIASRLVGASTKVVNGIVVRGRDQVMLKVTVAEVQRDVLKQLGVDLSGSLNYGTAVVSLNSTNGFSASGVSPSSSLAGQFGANPTIKATLNAMEQAGVIRTLAEPNLTTVSGETANFVAGGEFPIPTGLSCDTSQTPAVCQPNITFKKFGVGLTFTPS